MLAKNTHVLQKNADISKIKRALLLKGKFFETAKFQVSSLILTSFIKLKLNTVG